MAGITTVTGVMDHYVVMLILHLPVHLHLPSTY